MTDTHPGGAELTDVELLDLAERGGHDAARAGLDLARCPFRTTDPAGPAERAWGFAWECGWRRAWNPAGVLDELLDVAGWPA